MPHTLRRGGNATEQPVEETRYGPPQHSARTIAREQTLYGTPQHEIDVVVNAEPHESLDYVLSWNENRNDENRRERLPIVPSPNTHPTYP
ncbi:hypothetical protein [Haladaptatus sp. NG-SE-30]